MTRSSPSWRFYRVLVGFQLLHALPQLELDGARAEGVGILILHDEVLIGGPAAFRKDSEIVMTLSVEGSLTSMEKSCITALAAAARSASAASAFTSSRYFSTASLPEKPLVLKALIL